MSQATMKAHIVEDEGNASAATVNLYIDNPEAIGGGGGETPGNATTSTPGLVKQAEAITDLAADPTQADFNGLLAKLRTAGILAS